MGWSHALSDMPASAKSSGEPPVGERCARARHAVAGFGSGGSARQTGEGERLLKAHNADTPHTPPSVNGCTEYPRLAVRGWSRSSAYATVGGNRSISAFLLEKEVKSSQPTLKPTWRHPALRPVGSAGFFRAARGEDSDRPSLTPEPCTTRPAGQAPRAWRHTASCTACRREPRPAPMLTDALLLAACRFWCSDAGRLAARAGSRVCGC